MGKKKTRLMAATATLSALSRQELEELREIIEELLSETADPKVRSGRRTAHGYLEVKNINGGNYLYLRRKRDGVWEQVYLGKLEPDN